MQQQLLGLLVVFAYPLLDTAAHAARVLPQPVVESPGDGAGSVAPEPVKPRARTTRRLVYSCVTPSPVTFADRPCGELAVLRELIVQPSQPNPAAPPAIGPEPSPTGRRRIPSASHSDPDRGAERAKTDGTSEEQEHAEACRRLETRLQQIDAQMRAGYGAGEAGRLWDRWREAKSSLRESRC
jgi:hypothetical protein